MSTVFQNDDEKRKYLQEYNDELRTLRGANQATIELYRDVVEEGCNKMWPEALVAKAYSCYGGDEAYACNWFVARDLLLQLIAMQGDENPFHYNTLGYIYYYGRCSDGVPDYDTAFKYFSVGAANGVFESQYKLADMYIKGLGVFKSERAGAKIITSIYDENYDNFCLDIYESKFADVALRMGGLYENGTGVEKDLDRAWYFYLEAGYAIDLRLKDHDYYGDRKVQKNANEALERVKAELPSDYFKEYTDFDVPAPFGLLLTDAVGLDVALVHSDGNYYLVAKRFAPDEGTANHVLITIPQVNYCKLTDTVKLQVLDIEEIESTDQNRKAFVTRVNYDEDEDVWQFWYRERLMLQFRCKGFRFFGEKTNGKQN